MTRLTAPTVAEIMQRDPVAVPATCSIEEAAREMARRRYSSLLVVDEAGNLVGIVTERDAVRAIATTGDVSLAARSVREIMSSPVHTVNETTPLPEAIAKLQRAGVRRLLVVDSSGRSIGLVTQTDLLRAALERLETEQQRLAQQVEIATAELSRANVKLESLARQDGLLGIGNRRALEETLGHVHALTIRHGRPWSLLLVDVDHFKKYNDCYGHLAGDDALKRVASVLTGCLRASDHIFRYGGEELAMVLTETDLGGAEVVARRAVEAVHDAAIRHERAPLGVLTVSVGVAASELAAEAADWSVLAQLADDALYAAKAAGRNCWTSAVVAEAATAASAADPA